MTEEPGNAAERPPMEAAQVTQIGRRPMRSCAIAFAILLAGSISTAHAADEAMMVVQDLASKWTAAYNNGDAGKVADLYTADAAFLSGVLGALKGRTEIETAINRSVKQAPKITFSPVEAHENGNIVWGYWDYTFPDGPSGYGAITAVKEANAWRIAMHISNVKPKK